MVVGTNLPSCWLTETALLCCCAADGLKTTLNPYSLQVILGHGNRSSYQFDQAVALIGLWTIKWHCRGKDTVEYARLGQIIANALQSIHLPCNGNHSLWSKSSQTLYSCQLSSFRCLNLRIICPALSEFHYSLLTTLSDYSCTMHSIDVNWMTNIINYQ